MPAGIKIKSVSVEDLGSIVKQMINGALENTAQIAKLHQAVYEEWYFKKLAELKGSKSTETQVTLNQDPEQTQDSAGEKNNLRDKKPFFPSNISINLVVKNESARLKIRSQIFNTPINHCKFNSLMFLRDHQASTEDTNIDDKPENIVTSDGTHTDIEIIEVWNNNNNAQKRKLDKGEKYNPTKTDCKTQNNKT
ncbi:hypothetical protein KPH14_011377 [Odynerus spinipes]|uniref:Uncharacterized protein n=1 Tax=Odynerus spinipes TaxID=1348599 RepID=A0AAD9RJ72_9HYME|nr:hypothetical protein KPH14_011377 [Odynerus spinipes]